MSSFVLTIAIPQHNRAEREYVCRYVFEERLGIACAFTSTSERYTLVTGERRRLAIPDVLFAGSEAAYLHEGSLPRTPVLRLALGVLDRATGDHAADVLAPYAITNATTAAAIADDSITLSFDALAGVFFMLTRMEEVVGAARDRHDRFPAKASWAVRNGIELRPLVDETVAVVKHCCDVLWPGLARQTGSYTVMPSHDVDHPFLYHGLPFTTRLRRAGRKLAGDLMLRRSPTEALRTVAGYIRFQRGGVEADPYFTLRDLMSQSEQRGLRSTFFLIVQPSLPIDGRAYLEEPVIAHVVRELIERGHRVGLHASYQTLRNSSLAVAEAGILRAFLDRIGVASEPLGVRHHYLRWSAPEHWAMWHAAGATYDATLGYGDRVGFRCGTSHDFPVFDLAGRHPLLLRERPLLLMDGAICPEAPLSGRARQQTLDILGTVAGRCRAYAGTFELLWHNDFVVTHSHRAMYREVLDVCTSTPASC